MNVHDLALLISYHRESYPLTDLEVVGDLVQDRDRQCDFMIGSNNYSWWNAVGAVFRPNSMVEIGTRYGYSVKSLLGNRLGHHNRILVVDAECDPGQDTLKTFESYFRGRGVTDLEIRRVDSQTLTSLNTSGFDIGSVDALHSADGCYHDCKLVWGCLRPGGLMIVDDTQPGPVRDGCERFCRECGLEWAYLPSLRGIHLVLKP